MNILVAAAVGYLAGSIPFGLLLTRAAGLGDVRRIGSGNIGATNVLRTGNKGLAVATLLLDALKGLLPVMLAARWYPGIEGWVAATCELISLNIDLATRRVAPFPNDIIDNLAEMRSSHGHLPTPEIVGRAIQMPERLSRQ